VFFPRRKSFALTGQVSLPSCCYQPIAPMGQCSSVVNFDESDFNLFIVCAEKQHLLSCCHQAPLLASDYLPRSYEPRRWKCESKLLYVGKTFSGGNQFWLHSLDGLTQSFSQCAKDLPHRGNALVEKRQSPNIAL
jgi:hypothetical protein